MNDASGAETAWVFKPDGGKIQPSDWKSFIAERAASIHARLRARESYPPTLLPEEPTAAALRIIAEWKRAFSPGDEGAFRRRLAWDDLDEPFVLDALSRHPVASISNEWTHWLDCFVSESSTIGRRLATGETMPEVERLQATESIPFIELWIPIVLAARGALADRDVETFGPAYIALERQLIKEVALVSELTVYERFVEFRKSSNPTCRAPSADANEIYSSFVTKILGPGQQDFFSDFPVLSRQLATLVETWTESTAELALRLRQDAQLIGATFLDGCDPGTVTRLRTGISDRHHGGRRVVVVGFESGLRLVYKPRAVGLERAFHAFLSWSARQGLQPAPRAIRTLEREGYGWFEHVEPGRFEEEQEIAAYFSKAGSLMCFAYVLGGTDLHMENVIATKDGPVIIDAETLFQPELSSHAGRRDVDDSCLGTGLLTLIETDSDGTAYDIGGLRGRGGILAQTPKRRWRLLGTDALHFVEEERRVATSLNQVFLHGHVQKPEDYSENLIAGFEQTYRFLVNKREEIMSANGPLSAFSNESARVVLRSSKQYAVLLYTLAAPSYQRCGIYPALLMEALNRVNSDSPVKPRLWPLVADEREALEGFDIPRFTIGVHEVGMLSEEAVPVKGYFARSGLSVVSSRFARMGERELRRQVDLLQNALSASIDSRLDRPWAPSATPAAETRGNALRPHLERCAIWIGKELLDRAQDSGSGSLTWNFPDHERGRSGSETRLGLYDGSVGVGLFFAALGAVTGDEEWSEAARRAIVDVEGIVEAGEIDFITGEGYLGACDGIGSIVYATYWMARLLADDALLELAVRIAGLITEERILRDRHLDVMGGAAGALLALLALHRHSGDTRALALATICGEHLIATGENTGHGGVAWQARGGHLLAGFAHGAAGIAYALTRLFAVTGEHVLRDTASAAYRYERSLYSETRANWPVVEEPDDQGGQRFLNAWCHGAPGVGLGRVLALDVLDDDDVRSEIEVAIAATASAKSTGADHLCCGSLGRADILLTLGQRLGNQDLVCLAEDLVREVVARAVDRGHFVLPSSVYEHRVFAPGFFRGLSGVGYGLLRTAALSHLPTILGVEADMPVYTGIPAGEQS